MVDMPNKISLLLTNLQHHFGPLDFNDSCVHNRKQCNLSTGRKPILGTDYGLRKENCTR
jgi:hypothetical protein